MSCRCDICIEEECKGARNCNCDTCKNRSKCPKVLRPTIRITSKCTQSCPHCCFGCSPKKTAMMTIAQANKTAEFLRNNNIKHISIMGGEICCNPDWREIVSILVKDVTYCRLVTSGDTVVEAGAAEFLSTFSNINVSISEDRWHNNANVEQADNLLTTLGISHNVATEEQTKPESIVPVGRGDIELGVYSLFACYCHNPENRYAFLIDEVGRIYKCGFGSWNYAEVDDYAEGDFAERFKEFNQTFRKTFVSSCKTCSRSSFRYKRSVQNDS